MILMVTLNHTLVLFFLELSSQNLCLENIPIHSKYQWDLGILDSLDILYYSEYKVVARKVIDLDPLLQKDYFQLEIVISP